MGFLDSALSLGGAVGGGIMGSKGSGGQKAPKWLRKSSRQLGDFGKNLGQTPYTPYTGERVAGFSPDTLAAFDSVRNSVGTSLPYYTSALNAAQGLQNYQNQNVGPATAQTWLGNSSQLQQYMNPYIQNVIDAQAADAQNAYGQAYNNLASQAQAANAFGGSRFGVAQGQLSADSVRNQALLSAQLRSQGFDAAANLLGSDVAAQNQFGLANQQTAMQNQMADLQAASLRGNAAQLAGSLAGQYQTAQTNDAKNLGLIGQIQQDQAQKGLDVGYSNYWDQYRTYPSQQLTWWSGALQPGLQTAGLMVPNTGGGLAGGLGGAAMGANMGGQLGSIFSQMSDRRLKKNIKRIGTTPGGQAWYEFDYLWGEHSQGVMADESPPEAVHTGPHGFKMVDYGKIR